MLDVQKKQPARHGGKRFLLLAAALVLLTGAGVLWLLASAPTPPPEASPGYTSHVILSSEPENVVSITSTQRLSDGWTLRRNSDGALCLQGDGTHQPIDDIYERLLLDAVSHVAAAALLTDDPADYQADLADFGLDTPRAVVDIAYADGVSITLRIGDLIAFDDNSWMYMTVDGDDSLYALDKGTADLFTLEGPLLLKVEQPVMHRQRFDCLTLTMADGTVLQWTLDGAITNTDAQDRWFLTQPITYPADASALYNLRRHIESLQLGAYVAPATGENLALYGFDTPQMTLTVHQAAGDIGTTNVHGELIITAYPESTVTLVLGGAKSQDVAYVRCGDGIYLSSHYSFSALMDLPWRDTLSRYPVLTALGNLQRLTIATAQGTEEYVLTRTERVAANNELVFDEEGGVVFDTICTCNGETIPFQAFEAAYSRLITVSVSGSLPDGWTTQEPPHMTYTFEDLDGTVHTIALCRYDALHDAVLVNGQALFYLIQGGFALELTVDASAADPES